MEDFYKNLFAPKNTPGRNLTRLRKVLQRISLQLSFIHLRLRRAHKEDYRKVGKGKMVIGLQDSKIMCSLASFRRGGKGGVSKMHRSNGQVSLKANNLLLKGHVLGA